jgi:flagellar biosynthesis protein FlhG
VSAPNVIELPRAANRPSGPLARPRPRRVIAVGGGKGGIGKTMVSANLGIALAKQGRRTVLVDVDLGGANLHTSLGVGQPIASLSDFLQARCQKLEEVMVPTGVPNLALISGAQDTLDAANPKHQHKTKLVRSLLTLDVDYLVLDLGAGTSYNVLDFWVIADHGLVVILPEPTSVENAYRFVKAAFYRRLQHFEEQYGLGELISASLSQKAIRTPTEIVNAVRARDAALAAKLAAELEAFSPKLVVNQARTPADKEVGKTVVSAWKKFFGLPMDYLGAISYDDEAWKAVRKRRPILLERPGSEASMGLMRVAENLIALDGR